MLTQRNQSVGFVLIWLVYALSYAVKSLLRIQSIPSTISLAISLIFIPLWFPFLARSCNDIWWHHNMEMLVNLLVLYGVFICEVSKCFKTNALLVSWQTNHHWKVYNILFYYIFMIWQWFCCFSPDMLSAASRRCIGPLWLPIGTSNSCSWVGAPNRSPWC